MRGVFSDKLGQTVQSLFQFTGGIGFAFYYSWSMTLVMLGTAPLMAVAIAVSGILTVRFTKQASNASAKALAVAEEVIGNFRTVRSFSNEDWETERFGKAQTTVLWIASKKAVLASAASGIVCVCMRVCVCE